MSTFQTTRTDRSALATWLLPGLIMIITIVAVSIIASRNQSNSSAAVVPVAAMTAEEYQTRLANPDKTFDLVIAHEKLTKGPSEIHVKLGHSVNVRISTTDDEIQAKLDGYDIHTEATNIEGTEGGFYFVADQAGEFPFYYVEEVPDNAPAGTKPEQKQLGTIIVE